MEQEERQDFEINLNSHIKINEIMKKYVKIGIPIVLLALILIIGGFDGLIGVTFDGCLKDESYCMGPSATEFLGILINSGFILSLIFSIVVIGILLVIKIILVKKRKYCLAQSS